MKKKNEEKMKCGKEIMSIRNIKRIRVQDNVYEGIGRTEGCDTERADH